MKHRNHPSSLPSRAEEWLDFPVGTLSSAVRIELSGSRRAVIEGCRRIVEYGEDRICLDTPDGTVRFCGRSLCMASMNPSCAVITGKILSIEFL